MKKIFSLASAAAAIGFCSVSCTFWNETTDSISSESSAIWNKTADAVSNASEAVSSSSSELWDKTTAKSSELWDKTTAKSSELWDKTTAKSSELWDKTADSVGSMSDKVAKESSELWNKTANSVDKSIKSITQKPGEELFIDVSKMKNSAEFDARVNARLDRDLASFNAVDEIRMPVFGKGTDKAKFMALPLNKYAAARKTFALTFTAKDRSKVTYLFDKETQTLTITQNGRQNTYEFGGTMKDVPPYDVYMAYAFGVDLTRIAHKITLRTHEACVPGTGKSKEPFLEPDEFLVAGVPCICYDIELKPRCAPAESMSMFFDIELNTPVCIVINYKQPQPVVETVAVAAPEAPAEKNVMKNAMNKVKNFLTPASSSGDEAEQDVVEVEEAVAESAGTVPVPDPVPPKVIVIEWRERDGSPMPYAVRATDGSFAMQLDDVKLISLAD